MEICCMVTVAFQISVEDVDYLNMEQQTGSK